MSAPRHRQRGPNVAHAPAAPAELRRRRTEQIPTGADHFVWFAGEVVLGPAARRRDDIIAGITALSGEDPGR
jgi:hypothetical protein